MRYDDQPSAAAQRTGSLLVLGQLALLGLIVLLPDRQDWALPARVALASQVATWVGILLMVTAATALRRGLTALPQPNAHAQLRTGGLYRYVRHPVYSGLLLFASAQSLASENAWSVSACVLLVVLINGKARWEERLLSARFPDYPAYAGRTPRFIPGFPTRSGPSAS